MDEHEFKLFEEFIASLTSKEEIDVVLNNQLQKSLATPEAGKDLLLKKSIKVLRQRLAAVIAQPVAAPALVAPPVIVRVPVPVPQLPAPAAIPAPTAAARVQVVTETWVDKPELLSGDRVSAWFFITIGVALVFAIPVGLFGGANFIRTVCFSALVGFLVASSAIVMQYSAQCDEWEKLDKE
jgi:hypothetical protein